MHGEDFHSRDLLEGDRDDEHAGLPCLVAGDALGQQVGLVHPVDSLAQFVGEAVAQVDDDAVLQFCINALGLGGGRQVGWVGLGEAALQAADRLSVELNSATLDARRKSLFIRSGIGSV